MNRQELRSDELYHYGVLGMKWGQHKVKVYTAKAAAARKQKKTDEASKYEAKAKLLEKKHRRLAGSKTYDYTSKESTGKAFVKSAIFGTYGAARYNASRANKKSRVTAAGEAYIANLGLAATGGASQFVMPRLRENNDNTIL